jgi:hypothetical protein
MTHEPLEKQKSSVTSIPAARGKGSKNMESPLVSPSPQTAQLRAIGNMAAQRMPGENQGDLPSSTHVRAMGNQEAQERDIYDFSDVRIHKDSASAVKLGALAYTRGNDIHFAPGQYKPHTTMGKKIINHELGHVIQQRMGVVRPTTSIEGLPVNDNQGLENEADRLGASIKMRYMFFKKGGRSTRKQYNGADLIQRRPAYKTGPLYSKPTIYGGGSHMYVELQAGDWRAGSKPEDLEAIAQKLKSIYPRGNWKKGHLLNQKLGGYGNRENLTMITGSVNTQMTKYENGLNNIKERLMDIAHAPDLNNISFTYEVSKCGQQSSYGTLKHVGNYINIEIKDTTPGGFEKINWGGYDTSKSIYRSMMGTDIDLYIKDYGDTVTPYAKKR